MKGWAWSIVGVCLLGLVGWRVYVKLEKTDEGPRGGRRGRAASVAVEVSAVRTATLRDISLFTGTLQPHTRFEVAPKIAGRLERLTVDVGDTVQSGQLVAELDDAEYAQQVEQARAALAVARATVAECTTALDISDRELGRMRALREKKVASEAELDEAEASHAAAKAKHAVALADVSRCEAALRGAEVRLSYARIAPAWTNADVPRVVGERYVDEGAMLQPNTPIVSILDNSVMIAQIDVIERDYPKLRLGQSAVLVTDGFPGREFTGKILRIAPLLKETSRQARVEIEVPNEDGVLKPGMFIRARIEFDRHEDVPVVPLAALARREGRQGVFVANPSDKTARFVPVTVGISEGELIEIVEPALTGSVVTLGHHLLEDGANISLPTADAREQPVGTPNERAARAGGER